MPRERGSRSPRRAKAEQREASSREGEGKREPPSREGEGRPGKFERHAEAGGSKVKGGGFYYL